MDENIRHIISELLRAVNIALDHDCGGDVFGVNHNDVMDVMIAAEKVLAQDD